MAENGSCEKQYDEELVFFFILNFTWFYDLAVSSGDITLSLPDTINAASVISKMVSFPCNSANTRQSLFKNIHVCSSIY